jgi:hypothetical protein
MATRSRRGGPRGNSDTLKAFNTALSQGTKFNITSMIGG